MPTLEDFQQFTESILKYAQKKGASDVRVDLSTSSGQHACVRKGEVETLETFEERAATIEIYLGQRRASASCSILDWPALQETTDAAFHIARFSAEDAFAGLAEPQFIVQNIEDFQLYHPQELSMESAIHWARETERYALAESPLITNSEGASFQTSEGFFLSTHTHRFSAGFPYSRFGLSAAVIAEENQAMQRDFWFHSSCDLNDLQSPENIGKTAAKRALRRLNPKRIRTGRYPVLFEPMVALSLLQHFIQAASGQRLYQKSSFLNNRLETAIFPNWLTIDENPFVVKSLASSSFDDDGVATMARPIVQNGCLKSYFLSAYSARKLGLAPTGHAGGVHNLSVVPGTQSFQDLLSTMQRGLVVSELLGQGVNLITGDYSQGACGFWVENGEIVHAVEEITIAGNLKTMFSNLVALGNDSLVVGAKSSPSWLIDEMTVAA